MFKTKLVGYYPVHLLLSTTQFDAINHHWIFNAFCFFELKAKQKIKFLRTAYEDAVKEFGSSNPGI